MEKLNVELNLTSTHCRRAVPDFYRSTDFGNYGLASRRALFQGSSNGMHQTLLRETVAVASPSVLLVEDDPAVLHMLRATMEFGGFDCEPASSASEAIALLSINAFDSILLDLKLPDAHGDRLIQDIRSHTDAPILVVSGESSEGAKIRALDAGADDFVVKPFLPGELLARLRAVLRRASAGGPAVSPRDRELDRIVEVHDPHSMIRVGSMEGRLLHFLKQHAGELVTSDQIIEAVWGNDVQRSEKNVRVLIATLRRKLDRSGDPVEIVNEHGRGYRLRRKTDNAAQR